MSWICTNGFNHGVDQRNRRIIECARCGTKAVITYGNTHKFETTHRKVCPLKTRSEELLSGQTAAQTSKM